MSTYIELQNATVRLGGTNILEDSNIKIDRDQLYLIMGRSGTGKSTLLKTLALIYDIDSGTYIYGGKDIHQKSFVWRKRLRRNFGYVFQDGALFDYMTVCENISFPILVEKRIKGEKRMRRKDIRASVVSYLDIVDLDPSILDLHPHQLSGGMKKRVAIARALAKEPNILIFDEPTSGLDVKTSEIFLNYILKIQEESKKQTIIITTHDLLFLDMLKGKGSMFYINNRMISPNIAIEDINDSIKNTIYGE